MENTSIFSSTYSRSIFCRYLFPTFNSIVCVYIRYIFIFQVPMNETDFNILWMGNHPKPDILRNLQSYQKVNHFPR